MLWALLEFTDPLLNRSNLHLDEQVSHLYYHHVVYFRNGGDAKPELIVLVEEFIADAIERLSSVECFLKIIENLNCVIELHNACILH